MFVLLCVCVYGVRLCVSECVCAFVSLYVCMIVLVCDCVRVSVSVYFCVLVCICVFLCVCACVSMCLCVYVWYAPVCVCLYFLHCAQLRILFHQENSLLRTTPSTSDLKLVANLR